MVIEQRLPQVKDDLPILAKILVSLRRRLLAVAEMFINDQVTAIGSVKVSARKRTGVFAFVPILPQFICNLERLCRYANPSGTVRDLLDKTYEKVTAAIFRSLDALAAEADRGEDEKERINASVMNIRTQKEI